MLLFESGRILAGRCFDREDVAWKTITAAKVLRKEQSRKSWYLVCYSAQVKSHDLDARDSMRKTHFTFDWKRIRTPLALLLPNPIIALTEFGTISAFVEAWSRTP